MSVGTNQKKEELINAMLKDELEPKNKFMFYLLAQTKETREKLRQTQTSIAMATQQLEDLRENSFRLQGQLAKYLDDMKVWVDIDDADQPGSPDPMD